MDMIQHIFSTAPSTPPPTLGTKLSYKSGHADRNGDSTVIVLQDGKLLELRRGLVTKFDTLTPRRQWPSVDAWRATLPARGQVTETPPITTRYSSDLQHIKDTMNRYGSTMSWTQNMHNSLRRIPSTEEYIADTQKHIEKIKATRDPLPIRDFLINMYQKEIAKVRKEKAHKTHSYCLNWYKNYSNAVLYGVNGDMMQAVAINAKEGLFAVELPNRTIRMEKRLRDLGFTAYKIRVGDKLMPLPLPPA